MSNFQKRDEKLGTFFGITQRKHVHVIWEWTYCRSVKKCWNLNFKLTFSCQEPTEFFRFNFLNINLRAHSFLLTFFETLSKMKSNFWRVDTMSIHKIQLFLCSSFVSLPWRLDNPYYNIEYEHFTSHFDKIICSKSFFCVFCVLFILQSSYFYIVFKTRQNH